MLLSNGRRNRRRGLGSSVTLSVAALARAPSSRFFLFCTFLRRKNSSRSSSSSSPYAMPVTIVTVSIKCCYPRRAL